MNEQGIVKDLTKGSVFGNLVRFSLPLMLANTLQVGFNLVDMYFVSNFAGTQALSAVSIGGQLTMLMFSFFVGIATCGQIYVAQTVGAGRRDQLNTIIGNLVFLSVVSGIFLMLVIPLGIPILKLMNTPAEILDDTYVYLVICAAINVFIALYNGLCGVLRGMGDSKHPTMFIAVATVVNIVLDYVLVGKLEYGVSGAAFATIISQSMACFFAVGYLYKHREAFGFDFKLSSMKPDGHHMKILIRIALPVTTKQLCISLSMLFVNTMINNLGVIAVAVTGVANRLVSVMSIVSQSSNDATASMVGQNIAAGEKERVSRTLWNSVLFNAIFCVVICSLFLAMPTQVFGIFSSDPEVLAYAPSYMKACCAMMVSFAFMAPTMGLINGVGFTTLNMVIAIADGVVARIFLSIFFGSMLGMGALGFFLGNCLAGYVSVLGGWIYFLGGWWKKRATLVETSEA